MFLISRRTMLARAACSVAGLAAGMAYVREALAQGEIKPGVYGVKGPVTINGQPMKRGQLVSNGDAIASGNGGEAVVIVERDAFLIRGNSQIEFLPPEDKAPAGVMRVVAGRILSVFTPSRGKALRTQTATIGIRGTGAYLEASPEVSYICICYGEAQLDAVADAAQSEVVRTTHHDSPRYVYATAATGPLITLAPMINHTDAELIYLEGLVGRKVPFSGPMRY